jgi:hypothetical protein
MTQTKPAAKTINHDQKILPFWLGFNQLSTTLYQGGAGESSRCEYLVEVQEL